MGRSAWTPTRRNRLAVPNKRVQQRASRLTCERPGGRHRASPVAPVGLNGGNPSARLSGGSGPVTGFAHRSGSAALAPRSLPLVSPASTAPAMGAPVRAVRPPNTSPTTSAVSRTTVVCRDRNGGSGAEPPGAGPAAWRCHLGHASTMAPYMALTCINRTTPAQSDQPTDGAEHLLWCSAVFRRVRCCSAASALPCCPRHERGRVVTGNDGTSHGSYEAALRELGSALAGLKRERGAPSYRLIRSRGVRVLGAEWAISPPSMSEIFAGRRGPSSLNRLLWLVRTLLSYDDGEEGQPPERRDRRLEPWRERWNAIEALRAASRRPPVPPLTLRQLRAPRSRQC